MIPSAVFTPDPHFIDLDGASIATRLFEPAGRSAGDIVLCHGTPWSSQIWLTVADALSRDYRVFLWDMPGYGESAMSPGIAVDLRTQASRLAALLAEWGLRRAHVVAHDVGGAVALGTHLMQDVDFASLFLWDAVTLDPWGSPFFRLVAAHPDVFAQLPPALHAALVREYVSSAVGDALDERAISALALPWLDAEGQAAFYRQIASLSPADTRPIAEQLAHVRCPTRVGWGTADPWIPLGQAYELQRSLPGHPKVVELEGVGHLTPLESPSGVSEALLNWFADRSDS